MTIDYEDMYRLAKSDEVSVGGIGCIYAFKDVVYKLTFNLIAFIHNINSYYMLNDNKIPCAKLFNFSSVNFSEYVCINKHFNNLKRLYDKCPSVYNGNLYILKYERYDGNAYSLFSNCSLYSQSDLDYFKVWSFSLISSLNSLNIFHNDLKMDNILIKRLHSTNGRGKLTQIYNFIICNRTCWEYAVNDFDMMMQFNDLFSDSYMLTLSLKKLGLIEKGNVSLSQGGLNGNVSSTSIQVCETINSKNILKSYLSVESMRKLIYVSFQ